MKATTALLVLVIFAILLNTGSWLGLKYSGLEEITAENGPLEMLQVLFVCLAVLLYSLAAWKPQTPKKQLYSAIALTFFTFLIRELDLRNLDLPGLLTHIASGTSEKAFIAAGLLGLLYLLIRYRMELIKNGFAYIPTLQGGLIVAGAVFMVAGAVFDKELIETPYFRLYEEVLELNGYFLLFSASLLAYINPPGR